MIVIILLFDLTPSINGRPFLEQSELWG